MSIDRDTFENASEEELAGISVPEQVLGFLADNEDRAFKAREIVGQIDGEEDAVSTALSRLKARGLVKHKATYWQSLTTLRASTRTAGTNRRPHCSTTNSMRKTRQRGASTHLGNPIRASRTNSDRRRNTSFRAWRYRVRC